MRCIWWASPRRELIHEFQKKNFFCYFSAKTDIVGNQKDRILILDTLLTELGTYVPLL